MRLFKQMYVKQLLLYMKNETVEIKFEEKVFLLHIFWAETY